jgi:HlyD family secretion protein
MLAIACTLLLSAWGVWQTPSLAVWRTRDTNHVLMLSGNIEAHESVLSFKTVQSRILELLFQEGQAARSSALALAQLESERAQKLASENSSPHWLAIRRH